MLDARQYFTERLTDPDPNRNLHGLASACLGQTLKRDREDAIQEVLLIAWNEFQKLVTKGRNAEKLLGKVFYFAGLRVQGGRELINLSINDVMSWRSRYRHDYRQEKLPDEPAPSRDDPELKMDLDDWKETLSEQQRQVVDLLASGLSSQEIGDQLDVSRARIYQLRCDLITSWYAFTHAQV